MRPWYNGTEAPRRVTDTAPYGSTDGDSRVVFGRYDTDWDGKYATVQVDELVFFNQALDSSEVMELYSDAL